MIDNFVQIFNSRRLVSDDRLLDRQSVLNVLKKLVNENVSTHKTLIDDFTTALKEYKSFRENHGGVLSE